MIFWLRSTLHIVILWTAQTSLLVGAMSWSLSCLTDYHLTLLKWIPMLVISSWICICEGQGDDQLKGLSHKDNGLKAYMHNFGFLKSAFQRPPLIDMFQWSTCGSPTQRATSRSECVSEDNLGSPSTAARTLWVFFHCDWQNSIWTSGWKCP